MNNENLLPTRIPEIGELPNSFAYLGFDAQFLSFV